MKKTIVVLFLSLFLIASWYSANNIHIKQDIVCAFSSFNAIEKELFDWFQKKGPYKAKIFIAYKDTKFYATNHLHIEDILNQASYIKRDSSLRSSKDMKEIYRLLPFLKDEHSIAYIKNIDVASTSERALKILSIPGSSDLLSDYLEDPFMIKLFLASQIKTERTSGPLIVTQFTRTSEQDLNRIGDLEKELIKHKKHIAWIGEDFFAYTNYNAIKHDVILCSAISTIVALVLFSVFCPQWIMFLILLVGTYASLLFGVLLVQVVNGYIYAIAIGFVSTFVGFNNEYLIHLSGLDNKRLKKNIVGLGSAIGTTFVGFVVLLFSGSEIIRQFGLISIGGMIGFILIMILFQPNLKNIEFREISLKKWFIKKQLLLVLTIVFLISSAYLGTKLKIATNISDFRYETELLKSNMHTFDVLSKDIHLTNPHAYELTTSTENKIRKVGAKSLTSNSLISYKAYSEQEEFIHKFKQIYKTKYDSLKKHLVDLGLHLPEVPVVDEYLKSSSFKKYLITIEKTTGIPMIYQKGNRSFSILYGEQPASLKLAGISLNPKVYYDNVLSNLERQMIYLFLIGLIIMFIYLIPWQLNIYKTMYIFMPLLISFCGVFAILLLIGKELNLVHVMGFILVIALALDYGSIIVSSSCRPQEQSKVFLTGLMSIATFGSLLFAKHPVLNDLGLVVFVGTLLSLSFTIFIRHHETHA